MPVEYRGFEGVTKFFYLACTKIQGVQVQKVKATERSLFLWNIEMTLVSPVRRPLANVRWPEE